MKNDGLKDKLLEQLRFCIYLVVTELLEGLVIAATIVVHYWLGCLLDAYSVHGNQRLLIMVLKGVLQAVPLIAITVHLVREVRRMLRSRDKDGIG